MRVHMWEFEQRGWARESPDAAIRELNHRFLEHDLGYQYIHGKVIRLDTTYTHAEVIKPELTVSPTRRSRTPRASSSEHTSTTGSTDTRNA